MAAPDSTNWSLTYDDPRSHTRFLFSIPPPMLRDLRVLAKSRGIAVSELLRQLITREVADFLRERPDVQASFKGKLPMQGTPPEKEPDA
jgi:hypothetical protein